MKNRGMEENKKNKRSGERDRKTQGHRRSHGRALVFAAVFTAAAAMESFGFSLNGPGYDGADITYYGEQPENNPAYNTGWNQGGGPGNVGGTPQGSREDLEENIYAGGPGSEDAQKLAAEEAENLYIHNTYRGGTWEALSDGKWRLLDSNGQPVSSQWAYVDGKTYILDMYGVMLTGFQKINGNWYYFNSVGAMQTGWLLKEGKYYFLNSDGSMAYGWMNSQGNWYYLDLYTGVMLTNAYAPDGRYVNAEGVMVP